MTGILLKNGIAVRWQPASVERVDLRIRGDEVVERGARLAPQGEEVVDLEGRVVLPGMVCAHTHLYASLATGMPPPATSPQTFRETLEQVWWRLDRALDLEMVETSALAGALDAAACGTTTLFDHHSSPTAIAGSLERVRKGVAAVGLRAALCYEVSDRGGATEAREGIAEHKRLSPAAEAHLLVGAHASFTLSDASLGACAALARELSTGVHIHVAEDDVDSLETRGRYGCDLVGRLVASGVAGPRALLAHAVRLTRDQVHALAEAGCWFVHNPRSNMNNAVGYAPVPWFPERTALGTDGIGGDLFAEARAAFLKMREERTGLGPDRVLAMLEAGQRLASETFGRPFGTLAPGCVGDLAILDYGPPTPLTQANLASHLLFGMEARHVSDVIVGGRFVLRDRKFPGIDLASARARTREAAEALWRRMA